MRKSRHGFTGSDILLMMACHVEMSTRTDQLQTAVLRIETVLFPPVPRKSQLPRHHKLRPIDQQRASLACLATKKVTGAESATEIPNFIGESMPPQLLSSIPHRQRLLPKSQLHRPWQIYHRSNRRLCANRIVLYRPLHPRERATAAMDTRSRVRCVGGDLFTVSVHGTY
jgi:hypothetical protein